MDRLVQRLDELVDEQAINDDVVVQVAASTYRSRHIEIRPVLPYDELVQLIRAARAVISHAGPGSLATIRMNGKIPVVVARSHQHGEHVDDHQVQYARRLSRLPGYIVIDDLAGLPEALRRAESSSPEPHQASVSLAVQLLENISGCVSAEPR